MATHVDTVPRHALLSDFVSRVWGPSAKLAVGDAAMSAPDGQRFLALPSLEQPRLLVPLNQRTAGSGALTANLGLRRGGDKVKRVALATAVRTGYYERFSTNQAVGVLTDGPGLVPALRRLWRADVAAFSVGVRPVTPNYKPTLVGVDADGRTLGYLKIGWNAATVQRLSRERDAMQALSTPRPDFRSPRVLAELDWNDRRVLVVEPLPRAARRFDPSRPAPLHLVREALTSGRLRPLPELLGHPEQLVTGVDEQLVELALRYAARLGDRFADLDLPIGVNHGDWVPWNLGVAGRTLWAWDWEHSQPQGSPLGDIAHWYVQIAHIRQGRGIRESFLASAPRIRARLIGAGCTNAQASGAIGLAVLTAAGRALELHEGSGLWRDGVREGLVELLTQPDQVL